MFADKPPTVVAEAPGRVNLIGEHTDYSGGFVLPVAIPQKTIVELGPRDDERAMVESIDVGGPEEITDEVRKGGWSDYVAGVTWALRRADHCLGGFDARIRSNVPLGSGLSSSAALLVAVARGLRALFKLELDDVAIARIAHVAEHDFVGAPVGTMDQMACSLADEKSALFLDTHQMTWRKVALPAGGQILVIDSGVAHQHATGDYRTRRAECEAAAAALGVSLLRNADLASVEELAEPLLAKRARHVVTENARVWACVEALEAGAHDEVGRLFVESHLSLRDDFAVSVPAVDALVEAARAAPGVFGARMTGGGFGGAIVAWVEAGRAAEAGERACASHKERGFGGAKVLVP